MKASQYKANAARHICVYGAPKTGKTELVGTLAKEYRLWWFSLDDGIKTLFQDSSAARPYLDNIELFNIPDRQKFPVAMGTMLKVLESSGPLKICHKHGLVNCAAPECKAPEANSTIDTRTFDVNKDILVIDHYAQLMDSVNNWLHRTDLKADNWDNIKSTFDDWAKHGAISDRYGGDIQNATFNVVVISQEVRTVAEDGTTFIAPVGGTRNKSSDFARYFDDVIYTEIMAGKYMAHSTPADKSRVVVGSRAGKKLTQSKDARPSLLELFK